MIAAWQEIVDAKRRINREFNVSQHWTLNATNKSINNCIRICLQRDDVACAATSTRDIFKKETVHRVSDTEAEHATCSRVVAHCLDDGLIVRDERIGQHEDDACARFCIFKPRAACDEHAIGVHCRPCAVKNDVLLFAVGGKCHGNVGRDETRRSICRVSSADLPTLSICAQRAR